MPLFAGFLKNLRDNNKTRSNDNVLEEELLKYMRLINKIVSKPTIKDEFDKLSNNLIKEYVKDIRYMVDYINKGKKLRERSVDPDIRDKFIAYCDELPFGILSYSSYIVLKKMKIVSSVIFDDEYKLLGTKSKKKVTALKILKMPLFIRFLKTLRNNSKTHFDDVVLEDKLSEYIVLNKKETEYVRIEEFTNRLREIREVFEQENMIKENKKQLRKEIHELELKKCE